MAKGELVGGGVGVDEGEGDGVGVGLGVGDGVGLGLAESVVRSNPANTSVVANNDVTGLVIGFIPQNRTDLVHVRHGKGYVVVTLLTIGIDVIKRGLTCATQTYQFKF